MRTRTWNRSTHPFAVVGQGTGELPNSVHRTWRAAWQQIRRTHNEPYCAISFRHPTLTQEAYEAAHPELRHR
jgi:hypothetical protein